MSHNTPQRDLGRRVVVVAGAASAVREAIVLDTAARGAAVAFLDAGAGDRALAERAARSSGIEPLCLRADIGTQAGVDALFDAAAHRFGEVHALIHAAPEISDDSKSSLDSEEWDDVVRTRLTSPFLTMRRAVRDFLRNKTRGRIVNVGASTGSSPSSACGAAATAGLEGLTRRVARDHAADGIAVNLVFAAPAEANRPGAARQVAGAALFFLGERSVGLTGQCVRLGAAPLP